MCMFFLFFVVSVSFIDWFSSQIINIIIPY